MKNELVKRLDGMTGSDFIRVKNDINGNGRYVLHFLKINDNYEKALNVARKAGGKIYRSKNKEGIVFQSSSIKHTILHLKEAMVQNHYKNAFSVQTECPPYGKACKSWIVSQIHNAEPIFHDQRLFRFKDKKSALKTAEALNTCLVLSMYKNYGLKL